MADRINDRVNRGKRPVYCCKEHRSPPTPPKFSPPPRRANHQVDYGLSKEEHLVLKQLKTILQSTPCRVWCKIEELLPGLFLGDSEVATDVERLSNLGITHVLNCAPDEVVTGPNFYAKGVEYQSLNGFVDDLGTDLLKHWERARDYIHHARSKGGKVLVHCRAGVNRSGAVALAYIMWSERCPILEVARRVKEQRYLLVCNEAFQEGLVRLSTQLGLLRALPVPSVLATLPESVDEELETSRRSTD